MFFEISRLITIQHELFKEGELLRGGMTIDDIFVNRKKDILFGPAMNQAVYLEEHADFPRIVLDPDFWNKTQLDISEEGIEKFFQNGCLVRDSDNVVSLGSYEEKECNTIITALKEKIGEIEKKENTEMQLNKISELVMNIFSDYFGLLCDKRKQNHGNDRYSRKTDYLCEKHNSIVEKWIAFMLYVCERGLISNVPPMQQYIL